MSFTQLHGPGLIYKGSKAPKEFVNKLIILFTSLRRDNRVMCGLAFAREVLLLNETSECFSNEKFVHEGKRVRLGVCVFVCACFRFVFAGVLKFCPVM